MAYKETTMHQRLQRVATLFSIAILSIAARDARAQDPSAKIIEYGRYQVTVVSLTPAENVSGSVTVQSKDYKHIETTKSIPRKVGETWGYRVRWQNLPRKRPYEIKTETHHPPIKQPDGKILTKAVQKSMMDAGEIPDDLILIWIFLKGFEYEFVPGEWATKVFIDGVEVASMTFEVKK
jgi:hypothetical protein